MLLPSLSKSLNFQIKEWTEYLAEISLFRFNLFFPLYILYFSIQEKKRSWALYIEWMYIKVKSSTLFLKIPLIEYRKKKKCTTFPILIGYWSLNLLKKLQFSFNGKEKKSWIFHKKWKFRKTITEGNASFFTRLKKKSFFTRQRNI